MELIAVDPIDILNLDEEWNPEDEAETQALYGGDVKTALRVALLWPARCFIIKHKGKCLAAIVINAETNGMTYFTTTHPRPVRKYLRLLKCKIDAYIRLYGSIETEVKRDYTNAIKVVEYLGLKKRVVSERKVVYGREEKDC
jgi:hypothetical protein